MFTTDVLALAAYLKTQTFELVYWQKVQIFDGNGGVEKTLFYFNDGNEIEDYALRFARHEAFGNISQFEFARRELMRIAKSAEPNKDNTEVQKL